MYNPKFCYTKLKLIMEKYRYIIGQINALEATLQEISNLLEDKEQNGKATVIDINTKQ